MKNKVVLAVKSKERIDGEINFIVNTCVDKDKKERARELLYTLVDGVHRDMRQINDLGEFAEGDDDCYCHKKKGPDHHLYDIFECSHCEAK